jgi:O-antigen/teichoic acid export membrane protein
MSSVRSRNAIRNYASSLLFTVVTLAVGLFSSPLIESWVGPERFGAFRSTTACFAYLAMLEIGLNGAMGPALARALGRDDRDFLRELLAVGFRAYLAVACAAIALGLGLAAGITWLVPVGPALVPDLRLACLVALVGFLSLPLLPFRILADAQQRGFRISLLLTAQVLGVVGLTLLLVWRLPDWGITAQTVPLTLGALAVSLALAVDSLRRHRDLVGGLRSVRPSRQAWSVIWNLGWPALLMSFSWRISYWSDEIVLGKMMSPEMVTVLFFTQRLAVLGQGQLSAIGTSCWAGLAELYNRGELEVFRQRILELIRLVAILGVAGLGPIAAFDRHFVALWKGAGYYGGDLVILAASLNALMTALMSLGGWCISGTGRVRKLVAPSVLFAALNLTCSITFTRALGLPGPLLGTTVTLAFCILPLYATLLHREFGLPIRPLVLAVVAPLALGLACYAPVWWLARVHTPAGWPGLAAEMGLAAAGFLALGYALLIGPDERATWRARLGRTLAFWPRADAQGTSPPR